MIDSIVERTIEIPQEVKVQLDGSVVNVTGPKGSLQENLSHLPVKLTLQKNKFSVMATWPRKKEYSMVGTAAACVKNMIKGVTEGFQYKLKMVHAHFPITVKVQEDVKTILIENFTGEKSPRHVKIIGETSVKVSGEEVIVEGISLKDVSQTASNIELATKIKDKDQRVFLDGIYIFEKKK
ncbi:50S ribosomal protein L6 [[Eubacterium] cellulosolvens]